jgi:AbrB family looped-hinge helix DNA binding protein
LKLKVRVGPKGQIVIPKSVRDVLGVKPNDFVLVDVIDGKATLESLQVDPVKTLAEIAKLHGVKSRELVWGDKLYEEVLAGS